MNTPRFKVGEWVEPKGNTTVPPIGNPDAGPTQCAEIKRHQVQRALRNEIYLKVADGPVWFAADAFKLSE